MKIATIFLSIVLLLGGITANLSVTNAVITPGQTTEQQNTSIFTAPKVSQSNNMIEPIIDLNEQEKTTLANLLIQCPSGLFVYTGITGQIVIACLIDGVYGKLFNSFGQEILDINI